MSSAHPEPSPAATAAAVSVPPPKWWGQSVTIWGAIITALATVVPTVGPVIGLDITAELVRQLGHQVVQTAQAVGGLVGTIMTIWGRVRAFQPVERRALRLRV